MPTLMIVPDAETELNLETWQIFRAVARGILSVDTVGKGQIRITSQAIQAAATRDDLDGPAIRSNWIDNRVEVHRTIIFKGDVKAALTSRLPDEPPATDMQAPYKGAIRAAGVKPPKALLMAVSGDQTLPYRNQSECYAVSELRRYAQAEVRRVPGRLRLKTGVGGDLGVLYQSPDAYQKITGAAWDRFQAGDISVVKRWPDPVRAGSLIERRFYLANSSITGLDRARLIGLSF